MAVNSAIAGGNQVTSWANGWDVRDVRDDLTLLDTSYRTPFDQLLRMSRLVKKATNVKQEYYRRDAVIPHTSPVASNSAGNSAGLTQGITVANAAIFLEKEMVQYQNAGGAKFIGIVTGVNYTTNVVTVGTLNLAADTSNIKSANAFGAGAVAGVGTLLMRIAPARAERDTPPGTNRNLPVGAYNLIQSFANLVDESMHAQFTQNYTQKEGVVYGRETRESYRRGINRALYIGRRSVDLIDGKYVWTFDGLQAHNLPQFGYTAGAFTEGQAIDLAYAASTNNMGSPERWILCGRLVSKDMDKMMLNGNQNSRTETKAGVRLKRIEAGDVNLLKVHDPTLDDLGMSNKAFIVDPAYMARAEMEAYNETPIDGRENGTFDGKASWGNEKFCPLFTMPEAFMEITAN